MNKQYVGYWAMTVRCRPNIEYDITLAPYDIVLQYIGRVGPLPGGDASRVTERDHTHARPHSHSHEGPCAPLEDVLLVLKSDSLELPWKRNDCACEVSVRVGARPGARRVLAAPLSRRTPTPSVAQISRNLGLI
eukprot:7386727-Prymnesium_polylepis.1